MGRLYNRPHQTLLRRRLRTHGTPAEAVLWRYLQRGQTGYRFRRQHGVGPCVLDFHCPAARLAVELDGAVHALPEQAARDAARTTALAALGIRVVRFENRLVFEQPEGVTDAIRAACAAAAYQPLRPAA